MFIKNSSANKLTARFFSGSLALLIFLAGLTIRSDAQEKPNFAGPFKKCRALGTNNGLSQTVASDNEQNIIYTNDSTSLISLNPETNLENWKTQITGKLFSNAVADQNSLFFISSFEDKDKEKIFTLNSLSLKTGITNWQKKLNGYKNLELTEAQNKENLFLIAEEKSLQAIRKDNGGINWTKEFTEKILSYEILTPDKISILTTSRVTYLSLKDGQPINEVILGKSAAGISAVTDNYLLLGYPTGEFIKVLPSENKTAIQWKIKTGGSITGLLKLQEEVLVTSLDNFLYLFSIDSGKQKWKRRVGGRINIKPVIYDNYAVVINSAENYASIIELRGGKIINQIRIEDDNYFSGQPQISGRYFIFQTYKGIYFFKNASLDCK